MSTYSDLKKKISSKKAVIALVGLGYVGLPIAIEFCKKGYKVFGFDTNKKRVSKLMKGESYINDIPSSDIKKVLAGSGFEASTKESVLAKADVIIVCVPTPLRKIKEPDISYIVQASRTLKNKMRSGQLIIVESTTYPGTTRDVFLPELEKTAMELDKDFFLSFSPERIDPGNEKYGFNKIPKVVGGMTDKSTELSKLLYSKILKKVVGVSTCETAEVTKLLENTFRIVNIGLINEFAMLCDKLGIDVWEVINAANTKPFGFMPFYPGPGIGGHCIPADPIYLSWKARKVGFKTEMIDIAAQVNRMMPGYVTKKVNELLKKNKKKLAGARVMIVGVTYKKDVNDLRESPALEIIEKLQKKAKVSYIDPLIPFLKIDGINLKSTKLTAQAVKKQDIVVVTTDHSDLNYKMLAKNAKIIFDTRNVFQSNGISGDNIIKL